MIDHTLLSVPFLFFEITVTLIFVPLREIQSQLANRLRIHQQTEPHQTTTTTHSITHAERYQQCGIKLLFKECKLVKNDA